MNDGSMKIRAIAPWTPADSMALAIGYLRDGALSVDGDGQFWRHFVHDRYGKKKPIDARRAENGTRKGYLAVTLGIPKSRRTCKVLAHVLAWTWFNGPISSGLQVNHKDLNKANNRPSNLELTTGSENIRHSYANGRTRPWSRASEWRPGKPRLSDQQKLEVCKLRSSGLSLRGISRDTGISGTHVARILNEKGGVR